MNLKFGIQTHSIREDFAENPQKALMKVKEIGFDGVEIDPIGTVENPFVGSFDGNGATISNLTIESDPVVDGYIGWQDGNQNRSANVFTNRKD